MLSNNPTNPVVRKSKEKVEWKDKKKELKVEETVSGNKKKAKFNIKFLLINRGEILPKVKTDIEKIVNRYQKFSKVAGKLAPLKKKYNLKLLTAKQINTSQYQIEAELKPPEGGSGQRKAVNSSVPDVDGANLAHVIQRTAGQVRKLNPPLEGVWSRLSVITLVMSKFILMKMQMLLTDRLMRKLSQRASIFISVKDIINPIRSKVNTCWLTN